MTDKRALQANSNQLLMYQTEDGGVRLEVLYEGETVWLTQAQMSELFQTDQSGIARHIANIYESDELDINSTMQKLHNARSTKPVNYYNLDIIIAVGYRINSQRGTKFRIWATRTLREYIVKGFVMDDDRLSHGGSNYFDELVERVRRIRTSEFNFYRKVREIFATSINYDKESEEAHRFFATVQNKFHYAIHGHTAAELIMERVGRDKLNMGLTNWRNGVLSLQDAFIAKNYLGETELKRLELLVEQFLSFAELRYIEHQTMYMSDWITKLDQFIGFLNEKPILTNAGTVSRIEMEMTVRRVYEDYRERIIAEEALTEDQWERMITEGAEAILLPAPDDLEAAGISEEHYHQLLLKFAREDSDIDDEESDDDEIDDESDDDEFDDDDLPMKLL